MKEERLGKTITEQSKDRINLRVVAGINQIKVN
jgi:hypothetical protein